ncbi:general stress protein [Alteribacter natronophilus]|uniref:general stress protein n=1 Tax=Alteribacter natronophilus TaxID=2583810 RepID=UPI00110F0F6B|nr:general stress protein [Alteribacter natronophilus]TMW72780.1 low temperature-induced protein [Alteribacter natronophilus]
MEKKIIGGVFKEEQEAVDVIEQLEKGGFSRDDISIFAKGDDADNIDDKTDVDVTGDDNKRGKKAGKGLGIGAGSGAVLGGAAGLALLAIPGAGPIMAAGPIAGAIEGGVIGAGGGGLVGALTGAGIPEDEAKEYNSYVNDGYIVVLVEANQEQQPGVYDTFREHNTVNRHMYPDEGNSDRAGV